MVIVVQTADSDSFLRDHTLLHGHSEALDCGFLVGLHGYTQVSSRFRLHHEDGSVTGMWSAAPLAATPRTTPHNTTFGVMSDELHWDVW